MSTVLVTGGNGFIGSYVVDELLTRGYKVHALDTRHREPAFGAKIVLGDIRDATAVTEAVAHADGVIHLAGVLGTQETITNPRPAAETNIMGGLNVLEACAQYDVPLVNIAVGNWFMDNTYSLTKNTVERFCNMFRKERGLRVNVVRLVNAYGPRQAPSSPFGSSKVRKVTPSLICRAITSTDIEIYGDGEQVSDFVHVTDGAKALVNALEKADAGVVFDKPVEIGPSEHATINEVAALVLDEAASLGITGSRIVHLPMRPGEVPGSRVVADTSTLSLIDMSPESMLSLDEGMRSTVRWYHDNWLPEYQSRAA